MEGGQKGIVFRTGRREYGSSIRHGILTCLDSTALEHQGRIGLFYLGSSSTSTAVRPKAMDHLHCCPKHTHTRAHKKV